MTRREALAVIDAHKMSLINPVEVMVWTWLGVIIHHIKDAAWTDANNAATMAAQIDKMATNRAIAALDAMPPERTPSRM